MTSPCGAMLTHLFGATLFLSAPIVAQAPPPPEAARPAPPPATKLEAFRPLAGAVVTVGYTNLGRTSGVSVDVREFGQAGGATVRGVVVEVTESQYREERSFVDADEIPELLRGIDALLEVKANPTAFANFEVRYTTKGELQLTAYNDSYSGQVRFAVQAGRVVRASKFGLDGKDMLKVRGYFEAAQATLAKLGTRP